MSLCLWSAIRYHFFPTGNRCYGNQENNVSMVTMATITCENFIYTLRHTTNYIRCMVKIADHFTRNCPSYVPYKMPTTRFSNLKKGKNV